jgi:hypothetical protein
MAPSGVLGSGHHLLGFLGRSGGSGVRDPESAGAEELVRSGRWRGLLSGSMVPIAVLSEDCRLGAAASHGLLLE